MTGVKETELWGDRWDLNPQPPDPQSGALPIELRSPQYVVGSKRH